MARRLSIGSWMLRLITWDGVAPAFVWSTPFFIRSVISNCRIAIELTAVVLPIIAFFIRYHVGRRHISSNNCGAIMRSLQVAALCAGILVLVLIDAVMILTHVMPRGAAFAATSDLIIWAVLYAVYLSAMTFALYPGSSRLADTLDSAAPFADIPDVSRALSVLPPE